MSRTVTVTRLLATSLFAAFCLIVIARPTAAQDTSGVTGWCGTMKHWQADRQGAPAGADAMACFQYGDCDVPAVRDGWIVDSTTPFISLRMIVHIVRYDDGTSPITSETITQSQLNHLNEDFLPARIQFDFTINYIDNSDWRQLAESEIDDMKNATAIKPDSFLNVWVTEVQYDYSFATFPFYGDYLEPTGGIVMGHFHWVGGGNSVFAHEVGHCLGLYHTFRGVDETSECGACYESVGLPPSEGDLRGDFCSDTEPAPMYRTCSDAEGSDPCTSQPWGSTLNQAQSYMSYANSCMEKFTPQQIARMRCWTTSALSSWMTNGSFESDTRLGEAPLAVQFDLFTRHNVTQYTWDFDDGEFGSVEDPLHTFVQPGVRDITIDLQTAFGTYGLYEPNYIYAYADTIYTTSTPAEPGEIVQVDVYANNAVPLDALLIPFTWDGPLGLSLKSISTTGLRTEGLPSKSFVSFDGAQKRAAYSMTRGGSAPLAPGNGPVLSLFFQVPADAPSGVNPITLGSYPGYDLEFLVPVGEYEPVFWSGDITVDNGSCCVGETGNVDGGGAVNLTDVTLLVNALFVTFQELPCPAAGNTNGDAACALNLSDLTLLVNKLFVTFESTALCTDFDNSLCP